MHFSSNTFSYKPEDDHFKGSVFSGEYGTVNLVTLAGEGLELAIHGVVPLECITYVTSRYS